MTKTTAPLLSFDARGQIGKSQVYSSWKGIQYARRYVKPANPNTTAQQETRNVFKWLQSVYKYMPGDAVAAWTAYAATNRFTAINGWIKQNLANLRTQANLANLLLAPSANGGISPAAATFTAGAGQITVAVTAPSLPVGWTVIGAYAAAIRDQSPETGTLFPIVAGSDLTSPYSIVLAGLSATHLYEVGAWMTYTKPDGSIAYGQAIMGSATPT